MPLITFVGLFCSKWCSKKRWRTVYSKKPNNTKNMRNLRSNSTAWKNYFQLKIKKFRQEWARLCFESTNCTLNWITWFRRQDKRKSHLRVICWKGGEAPWLKRRKKRNRQKSKRMPRARLIKIWCISLHNYSKRREFQLTISSIINKKWNKYKIILTRNWIKLIYSSKKSSIAWENWCMSKRKK